MPPRRPEPPPPSPEGSFSLGYVGGGIAMVAVLVVCWLLIVAIPQLGALFLLMPTLAYIGLLVFGFRHGRRTGKGVLAVLLTFVGLVVLLVAACFGYAAIYGFNMH
jgi:hypothetical protein